MGINKSLTQLKPLSGLILLIASWTFVGCVTSINSNERTTAKISVQSSDTERSPAAAYVEKKLMQGEMASTCKGKAEKDGSREGYWECFYENGKKQWEMNYKKGKRDGDFRFWKPNGDPEFTSQFKDGFLDGAVVHFFGKGHPKIEVHFKSGHMEGLYREWNTTGVQLTESQYKEGALNGPSREWFDKGNLHIEAHYANNLLEGDYVEWWDNGKIRQKGSFIQGHKQRGWSYYDHEGREMSHLQAYEGFEAGP